jgi:hypothetical protein
MLALDPFTAKPGKVEERQRKEGFDLEKGWGGSECRPKV